MQWDRSIIAAMESTPGGFESTTMSYDQEGSYSYSGLPCWDERDSERLQKDMVDRSIIAAMESTTGGFELATMSSDQEGSYWHSDLPCWDERDSERLPEDTVDGAQLITRSCAKNFKLNEATIPDEKQRSAVLAKRQRTAHSRQKHARQREEVRMNIYQLEDENATLRMDIEGMKRYLESVQVRHCTYD
jgi:hypothetical protein